ncbi:MAG: hypothetical protein JST80_08045 [Bdellovibrionales bacterium]|nr:hypothetical protein [Bdellovibrionales bacterium]
MSQLQSNSNSEKNLQASQSLSNLEQRVWVKEQEVSALKVQNRHLLAKLDEAEKTARPNQINTQFVAVEVQKSLQPVIQELEKSIKGAFEILQSTMRGIYQQSQRCQQAVEEIGAHSRDIEVRVNEQRKADHVFFQEKILGSVAAFCDRMERQIENRLKSLSVIDVLNSKQNEMLNDMDQMKAMVSGIHKNSDLNRSDLGRIERDSAEVGQKLIEVHAQTNNSEELSRDVLQQVQNHRSEFKLLRGEMRSILDNVGKLSEKISLIEERVTRHHENNLEQELKEIETNDSIQELIDIKEADISNIQNVLNAAEASQNKEDLTLILDMLRSQKSDLKKVAKEAETRLRAAKITELARDSSIIDASDDTAGPINNEVQEISLNNQDSNT